jgi:transcriptional regulator with XRE-family HTH domain
MTDQRLGAVIRLIRIRRGWRQVDLATRAGLSQPTISRAECGHLGTLSIDRLRELAAVVDVRVDVVPRWRGGDLDRLLSGAHSALAESVSRTFGGLPEWVVAPEASFAFYGERGIVDLLAWNAVRRALLVIELKTDVVDVNELLGTLDRKRRLAVRIAEERGWVSPGNPRPLTSVWLIVTGSAANRRRIHAHAALLRAALPTDGRSMRSWLRRPDRVVAALSFWGTDVGGTPSRRSVKRVRLDPRRESVRIRN